MKIDVEDVQRIMSFESPDEIVAWLEEYNLRVGRYTLDHYADAVEEYNASDGLTSWGSVAHDIRSWSEGLGMLWSLDTDGGDGV